jgi:hypothetical protein
MSSKDMAGKNTSLSTITLINGFSISTNICCSISFSIFCFPDPKNEKEMKGYLLFKTLKCSPVCGNVSASGLPFHTMYLDIST